MTTPPPSLLRGTDRDRRRRLRGLGATARAAAAFAWPTGVSTKPRRHG